MGKIADMLRRREVAPEERIGMDVAEAIVEWSSTRYHKVFMEWLTAQADEPIALADHGHMIVASTRSNTLKEVRKHILNLQRKAQRLLEGENAS